MKIINHSKEVLKVESELIREDFEKGIQLFNLNYQFKYYKFNLKGELVEDIASIRYNKKLI
jgi:hypothetical protein